jgi:hypothetical protein
MKWNVVAGALVVCLGVAGTLYAVHASYVVYVLRSLFPFSQWEPIRVIGSISALFSVSWAGVWLGVRLLRRSKRPAI